MQPSLTRGPGIWTRRRRIANRELAHEIRKAADNPKVDFARLEQAARGFAKDMAPVEKELVDRGCWTPTRRNGRG
jgi:hypothetical protein